MFISVQEAKYKRICSYKRNLHEWDIYPYKIRDIKKGEKCLVISNGTIGKGARSYNYSNKYAIKFLTDLLKELKK